MNIAKRFPIKPLTLAVLASALVGTVALGLLAAAPSTAQTSAATDKSAKPGKPALTVSLVQPSSSSLAVQLSANGSVAAWQDISVGTETGGLRVAELHANVGDNVKKGQVLATFAVESVQADVALARAALAEAQANAAEASANAERARAVQGSGALSAQQVSQYLTQELTAKARMASSQAQLDLQLLRLRQTQVVAPDSGVVASRSATVGAVLGAGTELFKLVRQGRLEWRGEVTSTELERIKVGTRVMLSSPTGSQVSGRVRSVAPTIDAATRNGLVYVDLPGGVGSGFKPGMFARGEFDLGSSNALSVPQTAVVVRDGFSYVYRVGADQRVTQLKVQTGRHAGERIEVLRGVVANDQLVASGGSFLSDGDLVHVVNAVNVAPQDFKKNTPAAQAAPASAASK